jgi:hypothetical protein
MIYHVSPAAVSDVPSTSQLRFSDSCGSTQLGFARGNASRPLLVPLGALPEVGWSQEHPRCSGGDDVQ